MVSVGQKEKRIHIYKIYIIIYSINVSDSAVRNIINLIIYKKIFVLYVCYIFYIEIWNF